jgi:hypothetical protein
VSNRSRNWRFIVPTMLAAVVTMTLGVAPLAAAPPTAHSGNYGVHTLVDTSSYPGVTCVYPDANHLGSFKIRAPIVYAYDRTPSVDTEQVAWKFFIDYSDDPDPSQVWHSLDSSAYAPGTATDRENAHWPNRAYHLASLDHTWYRAYIKMVWYFPTAGQLDGSAVHTPVWYRVKPVGFPSFNQTESLCGATLG